MILQNIVRIRRISILLQRILAHQLFIAVRKVNVLPIKLILGAPLATYLTKVDKALRTEVKREILLEADALFEQGQYLKLYEKFEEFEIFEAMKKSKGICGIAKFKHGNSADMLWRLSRALYHMSKDASEEQAKAMIYEAYDLVRKALSLADDNHAVHKWYAILLDGKCNYEGKKARIQQLQVVKDHMLRSLELNPKDATILYMLGNWCYHVSDLAWYQRKIAAAIFAETPKSSFEEALEFLLKAEEVDPNFYSQNLLLLGKTYLKLNKKPEARRYLERAAEYLAKNNDDRDAKKEATKLLNNL